MTDEQMTLLEQEIQKWDNRSYNLQVTSETNRIDHCYKEISCLINTLRTERQKVAELQESLNKSRSRQLDLQYMIDYRDRKIAKLEGV